MPPTPLHSAAIKIQKAATTIGLTMLACCHISSADEPFRRHRAELLSNVKYSKGDILFVGNSITQGNEWGEVFGLPLQIHNYGISGGRAHELEEHITDIITHQPKILFLMIGINDLADGNTPNEVAQSIKRIISQIQQTSPNTKIYLQSILPTRENPRVDNGDVLITNHLLRQIAHDKQIQYIDVWNKLRQHGTLDLDQKYTNDGVHLLANGYQVWCLMISHILGLPYHLKPNHGMLTSDNTPYYSQRSTLFTALPMQRSDILIIGGHTINSGQWSQLLHNPHVKNRGIGVDDQAGVATLQISEVIQKILTYPHQAPSQIIIQLGERESYTDQPANTFADEIHQLLDWLDTHLPSSTQVHLLSPIPTWDTHRDTTRVAYLNKMLQEISARFPNMTYTDLYTAMTDLPLTKQEQLHNEAYLTPEGYRYIAKQIAHLITK